MDFYTNHLYNQSLWTVWFLFWEMNSGFSVTAVYTLKCWASSTVYGCDYRLGKVKKQISKSDLVSVSLQLFHNSYKEGVLLAISQEGIFSC